MKNKLIVASALIASAVWSQAGIVTGTNIQNGTGDTVISNTAGAAYAGGIAAVGYFTTGFNVSNAIATNNYAALAANFNILTSAAIGSTTTEFGANIAGYYNAPSFNYGAPGAGVLGQTLYTFFGSAATLAASSAVGQQVALVQFPITIDADSPAPDSNNVNLYTSASKTVLIGTTGGTSVVNLSAIGQGSAVSNPSIRMVTVVPEPSVALLGAVGALGLLRRRRN